MEQLESLSQLLVYSAIAVYALAFILFALDIVSHGSNIKTEAKAARAKRKTLVAAAGGDAPAEQGPADAETVSSDAASGSVTAKKPRRNWLRAGFTITVFAWLLHLGGTVLRGIAAERVPWANMYEFALTGVLLAVTVFIFAQFWNDLKFLGVYITGLAALFLGTATVNYYVPISPLPPALQSAWLVVHVFVATLAIGFLAISSGLSILQLLRNRFKNNGFIASLPSAEKLETIAYRLAVVGFLFWSFTLLAGAIWAHQSWGRYWGWDTKEVWTFIIWVVYAGYLHARSTRGWRGTASAVLNLIGFGTILFNYAVVNVYFEGLHAYSGL